jgi:hypothetical protein
MGESFAEFLDLCSRFRHPDYWVTFNGGVWLVVCCTLAAFATIENTSYATFKYELCAGVVISLSVIALWYFAREAYWRWGTRHKVGVAYEGYRVPWDDWTRTRTELKRLLDDGALAATLAA